MLMKKLIYNRYLGELWLWMIFLEWVYYFYGVTPYAPSSYSSSGS